MDTIINKRLLLAKEFHLNACKLAKQTDPISKMMAVHNFHIGIEITLKAILLKYGIRQERELNISFEQLMNNVDNHPEFKNSDKRLPNRSDMINLNKMRGLVQHQVVEPESGTLDDWRICSENFLKEVFQEYFETDFESLNRISFIEDERLRELLERSLQRINDEKYESAACCVAAAFEFVKYSIKSARSDIIVSSDISRALRRSKLDDRGELQRALNSILERIGEVELTSTLLNTGMKTKEFNRFKRITPTTRLMSAGNPHFQAHPSHTWVSEDVTWALHFVINSIINWQHEGLDPKVPDHLIRGYDYFIASIS